MSIKQNKKYNFKVYKDKTRLSNFLEKVIQSNLTISELKKLDSEQWYNYGLSNIILRKKESLAGQKRLLNQVRNYQEQILTYNVDRYRLKDSDLKDKYSGNVGKGKFAIITNKKMLDSYVSEFYRQLEIQYPIQKDNEFKDILLKSNHVHLYHNQIAKKQSRFFFKKFCFFVLYSLVKTRTQACKNKNLWNNFLSWKSIFENDITEVILKNHNELLSVISEYKPRSIVWSLTYFILDFNKPCRDMEKSSTVISTPLCKDLDILKYRIDMLISDFELVFLNLSRSKEYMIINSKFYVNYYEIKSEYRGKS